MLWSRFLASALLGAACVVSGDPFVVEEDRKSAGVCDPNDTSGSGACHPKRLECMAWRQTGGCDPSGKRERRGDKDCASEVDAGASGFCECGDGAHVARSGCDHRPIVCSRACRDRDRHECVGGWRQTSNCSSVGTREPLADLPCAAIVPAGVSGYCECGGERRVRRGGCTAWEDELQPLRCDEACEGEETMYEVLEVESRASAKEIKKQFRTLSLKYHPDKAKGVHAAERFAEIRAAYDVLEDGDKREVYDTGGLMMLAKLAKGSVPRGPDSRASVEITLEMIYNGERFTTHTQRRVVCRGCRRSNRGASATSARCARCNERCPDEVETVKVQMGPFVVDQQQRVASKERCAMEKTELDVAVERGVHAGTELKFPRKSEQRPGQLPGDLILQLGEAAHARFRRDGDDLHTTMTVPLRDALLGFERHIDQLDGRRIPLAVPPGQVATPGQVFSIRGEGMPRHNEASTYGDMKVEVRIDFPKSLGASTRAWLAENFPL